MTSDELAERYASACFEIALEDWISSIRSVISTMETDHSDIYALDNQSVPLADRQRRMDRMIPAETPSAVRKFFGTLLSNNDVSLLPRVLADLERMATKGPSVQTATVTSAIELDSEAQHQVEMSVRARYGSEGQIRYDFDPQLIGGLRIRVGDEVIDGNIAAQLRELDSTLRRAN